MAWIHYDRNAILTVQNHVITRNPRIGVSHEGRRTWKLHIRYLAVLFFMADCLECLSRIT